MVHVTRVVITAHLKMDGWKTIVSFLEGLFSGENSLLVSGRFTGVTGGAGGKKVHRESITGNGWK